MDPAARLSLAYWMATRCQPSDVEIRIAGSSFDIVRPWWLPELEKRFVSDDKVKGPASYFPSIENKYGKPVSHWLGILDRAKDMKHMEAVALLKSEHGMGHGHANALVAYHRAKAGA